jgi:hypothetical protein
LLIFLEDSDHFLEPDVIDEIVYAELPDPSTKVGSWPPSSGRP